jgi:hypothetical protein
LIWRQVGHSFGDFFNFHVAQSSYGRRGLVEPRNSGVLAPPPGLTAPLGLSGTAFSIAIVS